MTQENKTTKASKDGDVKRETKVITSLRNTLAELKSGRDVANTEAVAVLEELKQASGRHGGHFGGMDHGRPADEGWR